jgi:hypothetical protein
MGQYRQVRVKSCLIVVQRFCYEAKEINDVVRRHSHASCTRGFGFARQFDRRQSP